MEKFMYEALKEAQKAYDEGEVPIGCVLVKDGKIIAKGYNKKQNSKNPHNHAEILAIEKACKKVGDWRLDDVDMYVTVEPCVMCTGACFNARIKRVVFGASNVKCGGFGGAIDVSGKNLLNHELLVQGGVLESECKELMQSFFRQKREIKTES